MGGCYVQVKGYEGDGGRSIRSYYTEKGIVSIASSARWSKCRLVVTVKPRAPRQSHTRSKRIGFRSWSRSSAVRMHMTEAINPAMGFHYFPRLPPQPPNITAHWLVPNYTAWWQRHMRENILPRLALGSVAAGIRTATCWSQVRLPSNLATKPLGFMVTSRNISQKLDREADKRVCWYVAYWDMNFQRTTAKYVTLTIFYFAR